MAQGLAQTAGKLYNQGQQPAPTLQLGPMASEDAYARGASLLQPLAAH